MVPEKEVLEKKLEAVNNQLIGNGILGVIAVLVLIFVPWVKFENWRFEISLEVIIALIVLIVCIARGFSINSKKDELMIELSTYSKKEVNEDIMYVCEFCEKYLKSDEALHKHYEACEEKKHINKKDNTFFIWAGCTIVFIGLSILFFINNKICLIPLILIGFIATPFFDKFFNHYKKKSNRLRHFEINWWKKAIAVLVIILIFVLINWLIPECPKSCNDNNSCTNDFCSKETGYKCMNPLKLNCNGNNICESGEYGTSDCPNCDDSNKCTVDSYDVGAKKCIHVEMKGCIK